MSVSSFKSGRSGSSRSEVRPASSPNSSRAIPCSVCRRPDHHPTPPHATPPGELQRRRAHRAAPCARRVHRPVRQPTDERAVLRRRQRALTKVRRRRESLTRRTRGRTESLQHARARAGRRERPHRALLMVPRRVRARPGLRRVPPLPSRVPVRRVFPTDTPVPPFGMRRARARRRGERRRPMHRPPRHRTRVAVGYGH